MDWVIVSGIVVVIVLLVGILIKLVRDNSVLKFEMKALADEVYLGNNRLFKYYASIKKDTKYIYDRMVQEKLLREILCQNTTKAREILDTMDLMKEVVLQNSILTQEVTRLKLENSDLSSSNSKLDGELCRVFPLLKKIHGQLDSLESYCTTEETRELWKRVKSKLSELNNYCK